jgi:predicted phage-related endonuclease
MSHAELEKTVYELQELKRLREELEAEIEAAESRIKAHMGDQEQLIAGPFKIRWSTVTSSRIDTTALKKELPDLAQRFTKTTTCRRFVVG